LTVRPDGRRLLQLRDNIGKRQNHVEEAAGLPRMSLTRYERSMPISLDHLQLLCDYYGVMPREITDAESLTTLLGMATRIAAMYDGTLTFSVPAAPSPPAAQTSPAHGGQQQDAARLF
jgi:transcriptional regulator with XRE-family HTH domain